MLKRFFNSQTKSITSAAFLVGLSTVASGVLGLIRDRLLAGRFGAGSDLDVYFAAFRIPDFIYWILIVGGVTAVFLPVFSEYFKKNQEEAWRFTNNVLNCFLVLLIIVCGILIIVAPWIINLITPGFSPEEKQIAVSLTRIMFLSPILFGLSNVFTDILQYFNRFLVYSVAPILYNLGIIFGILYLYPVFGLRGLAYGVILGAALYWLLQVPAAVASGYRYKFVIDLKHKGLLKVFKLAIPQTIGATAYQINLIIITAIASTLVAGSIAIFNFSNNIQSFPATLFGTSFAIAAFPALSQAWAEESKEKFLHHLSSTFRQILFLIIPVSFLMFIFRAQIIRLILGTGKFGWQDTRLTAASLGIFSLGIFASAFIPFLARAFYSFQNTKTPVIISLFSMFLNIGLCFLFVSLLTSPNIFHELTIRILKLQGIDNISVIGLPLALSISAIFQFSLLLIYLKRKLSDIKLREICVSLEKIILASFLMAVASYFTLRLVDHFIEINTFLTLLLQTAAALLVGGLVFLGVIVILKAPELETIKTSLLNRFSKFNGKNS